VTVQAVPDATISVQEPGWLTSDGTSLWVFTNSGEIIRIDPATNTVSTAAVVDPAFEAAGLWLPDFEGNLVKRIDPTSLAVIAQIPIPDNPGSAAIGDSSVWVTQHRGGTVTRIDPSDNSILATIVVGQRGPGGPHDVAFGLGSVWVSAGNAPITSGREGNVVRIDPATNTIQATIPIPWSASACGSFAITDEAVWMSSCFDQHTLIRIDPLTNAVAAAIDLGGYGGNPTLVNGSLWLTVSTGIGTDPSTVVRIDPVSNSIDRIMALGAAFRGESMLVVNNSVWISDALSNQVLRLPIEAFAQ
jgi:streptogramin lyase